MYLGSSPVNGYEKHSSASDLKCRVSLDTVLHPDGINIEFIESIRLRYLPDEGASHQKLGSCQSVSSVNYFHLSIPMLRMIDGTYRGQTLRLSG